MELANGRLPGGERLISEESILERRRPGIKIDDKNSYGLGLIISNEFGLHVIHHGGNTLGFSADMYFLPESGFGAVVLTNAYAAVEFLEAMRQKIRELVFGAEPRAEAIVETAGKAKADILAKLQTRVKTDDDSTVWIAEILGTIEARNWAARASLRMSMVTRLSLMNGQAIWLRKSSLAAIAFCVLSAHHGQEP
jgi:hypothetical protein